MSKIKQNLTLIALFFAIGLPIHNTICSEFGDENLGKTHFAPDNDNDDRATGTENEERNLTNSDKKPWSQRVIDSVTRAKEKAQSLTKSLTKTVQSFKLSWTKSEPTEKSTQPTDSTASKEEDSPVDPQHAQKIKDMSPTDIQELDIDIWQLTPSELKLLSPEQTAALDAAQIVGFNNSQLNAIDISAISPENMKILFSYSNNQAVWGDKQVAEMTPTQIKAILSNPDNDLSVYFNKKQMHEIMQKLSIKDRLITKVSSKIRSIDKALWGSSPRSQNYRAAQPKLPAINDKNLTTAQEFLNSYSDNAEKNIDTHTTTAYLKDLMKRFTPEQKRNVANRWVQDQTKKLTAEIIKIKTSEINPDTTYPRIIEVITKFTNKINANLETLQKEGTFPDTFTLKAIKIPGQYTPNFIIESNDYEKLLHTDLIENDLNPAFADILQAGFKKYLKDGANSSDTSVQAIHDFLQQMNEQDIQNPEAQKVNLSVQKQFIQNFQKILSLEFSQIDAHISLEDIDTLSEQEQKELTTDDSWKEFENQYNNQIQQVIINYYSRKIAKILDSQNPESATLIKEMTKQMHQFSNATEIQTFLQSIIPELDSDHPEQTLTSNSNMSNDLQEIINKYNSFFKIKHNIQSGEYV